MRVALVVGFVEPDTLACKVDLDRAGWSLARAPHAPAACERAADLRPAVVVLNRSLWASEKRTIREAASKLALRVIEAASVNDLYDLLSRTFSRSASTP